MFELHDIHRTFGPLHAVSGVSLTVAAGEVVAILGPNGAGKSTLMRIAAGVIAPTSGWAGVCGVNSLSPLARANIGFLPEGAPLWPTMTVDAYLSFCARCQGMSARSAQARRDQLVADLQLSDVTHRWLDALSKGYRRRAALAGAMLHDPVVLLLDEPTDGLDPNQKDHHRRIIREASRTKAVLISTHNLDEVEALCTRVVIMHKGRVVLDAPTESAAGYSADGSLLGLFRTHTHETPTQTPVTVTPA